MAARGPLKQGGRHHNYQRTREDLTHRNIQVDLLSLRALGERNVASIHTGPDGGKNVIWLSCETELKRTPPQVTVPDSNVVRKNVCRMSETDYIICHTLMSRDLNVMMESGLSHECQEALMDIESDQGMINFVERISLETDQAWGEFTAKLTRNRYEIIAKYRYEKWKLEEWKRFGEAFTLVQKVGEKAPQLSALLHQAGDQVGFSQEQKDIINNCMKLADGITLLTEGAIVAPESDKMTLRQAHAILKPQHEARVAASGVFERSKESINAFMAKAHTFEQTIELRLMEIRKRERELKKASTLTTVPEERILDLSKEEDKIDGQDSSEEEDEKDGGPAEESEDSDSEEENENPRRGEKRKRVVQEGRASKYSVMQGPSNEMKILIERKRGDLDPKRAKMREEEKKESIENMSFLGKLGEAPDSDQDDDEEEEDGGERYQSPDSTDDEDTVRAGVYKDVDLPGLMN